MNSMFSDSLSDSLFKATTLAMGINAPLLTPEFLALGLLAHKNNNAVAALQTLGVDTDELYNTLYKEANNGAINTDMSQIQTQNLHTLPHSSILLSRDSERIIKFTHLIAKQEHSRKLMPEHLLLSIVSPQNENVVINILQEMSIDYRKLENAVHSLTPQKPKHPQPKARFNDDDEDDLENAFSQGGFNHQQKPNRSSSDTPALDTFGQDLTRAAAEGQLDPIVGREKEIERLVQILSRRKKNNPILIGEPGVGKSAIVEGLASRIIEKTVSRVLFDKRVISLDIASIVAGTKYRGQFEERMKAILNELQKHNNIIVFVDEIHQLVGAGDSQGALDAANMLKPALARGVIQCIGTTTLDEYRKYIEKDGALERRFQKVIVEPTTEDETLQILKNIKNRYEEHHNVRYTEDALQACVSLTTRYISDRTHPDKAIDALDEAGSRAHISNISVPDEIIAIEAKLETCQKEKLQAINSQSFEYAAECRNKEKELTKQLEELKHRWEEDLTTNRSVVDADKVAEVVAMITNVPVQRIAEDESSRLLSMSSELQGSVIGQDDAISKIVKAIQRNRAGLKDPNKPIGSFIFLGPTGVGKTQLAKVLAKYLFDSYDNLIRIDMSEYMEKFNVSRLVGAPPGYVGYEEGGLLTEKVRRKPYSVVLLDEIEKAHPDMFHLLLQLLDEGQLTDSLGRKVDFRNTIIIMTSNLGSRQLKDFGQGIGFQTTARESQAAAYSKSIIDGALKKAFSPEFLNRIDEIVMFNSLTKADLAKIITIELKGLLERINAMGHQVSISQAAKDFLCEKGFDANYGARPLKRAIQQYIENPMSELLISLPSKLPQTIKIGVSKKNDELTFKFEEL